MFDADRQDKGILAGPVTNVPHWKQWHPVGGLIFLGTLFLGGRVRNTRSALVLPLLGALAACSIGAWGDLAFVTTRFASEWLWVGFLTALNLLVLAHAALTLSARTGWRERIFNLLERRAGQIAPQGWEFYAVTGTLFLTLAFPGFVYRYLLRRHD